MGSRKLEIGSRKSKVRSGKWEVGSKKWEVGGQNSNAPINVNPVGGGGVRARGGDLTNFKIF